jgi:hypothetical protein
MSDSKLQTRELLAEVYAETTAQEFTEGITGYTLENMIQEELDRLEGPVAGKYQHAVIPYLEDLKSRFAEAIDSIKDINPDEWIIGEGTSAINADEEPPTA